jgi:hypothetical protein
VYSNFLNFWWIVVIMIIRMYNIQFSLKARTHIMDTGYLFLQKRDINILVNYITVMEQFDKTKLLGFRTKLFSYRTNLFGKRTKMLGFRTKLFSYRIKLIGFWTNYLVSWPNFLVTGPNCLLTGPNCMVKGPYWLY